MTLEQKLILPFADVDARDLGLVGGKGANLGEMAHADLARYQVADAPAGALLVTVFTDSGWIPLFFNVSRLTGIAVLLRLYEV